MATLHITIEMNAAAFTIESNDEHNGEENVGPEVAAILRRMADGFGPLIHSADLDGRELRDVNGNLVGRTEVTS